MRWEIVILVFMYLSPRVRSKTEPFDVEDTKNSFYWRRSDGDKCEPFETYTVDCNRCICSADGVPYCTKVACIDMMLLHSKWRQSRTSSTMRTVNYDFNDLKQIDHY